LILRYLVSDGQAQNLLRLPVFFTRDASNVALEELSTAERRVLLTADQEVFADVDREALLLGPLPASVAQCLKTGSGVLNVIPLSAAQVLSYLRNPPRTESDDGSGWLTRFWSWISAAHSSMQSEVFGDSTFPSLRIFPCLDGIRCGSDNIFSRPTACPVELEQALSELYHVVIIDLPPAAVQLLLRTKKILSADDLMALLRHGPASPSANMNPAFARALRDHVVSLVMRSNRKGLKESYRKPLRFLPIFEACIDGAPFWRGVAANHRIVSISRRAKLLPAIRDTCFVYDLDAALAPLLEQPLYEKGNTLSLIDLGHLWTKHLPEQDVHSQVAFLEDVCVRRDQITPKMIDGIRQCPFVRVSGPDGGVRAPVDLLDPESEVALQLFDRDSHRIPRCVNPEEVALVAALRRLDLMRSNITAEIMQDCVVFSSNSLNALGVRHARACALLRLVKQQRFKCSGFSPDLALAWLPAEDGSLYIPRSCFDPGSTSRELFDAVAPVLAVEMPAPLRKILKMDALVPFDVVRRQLELTLQHGNAPEKHRRLDVILKELGRRFAGRFLAEADIQKLHSVTAERHWIPVEGGVTASVHDCAFNLPFRQADGISLWQIPASLASSQGVEPLMRRLGCPQE
jgi:hypothetical protein